MGSHIPECVRDGKEITGGKEMNIFCRHKWKLIGAAPFGNSLHIISECTKCKRFRNQNLSYAFKLADQMNKYIGTVQSESIEEEIKKITKSV